jgi:ATP-binding cassette subfamily D (ALD) long-chain fatty acid import protein
MKLEAAALVAGALGIYFTTKKTPIIKDSKNTAVAKGVGVNAAFLKQIKFLLRICIPSIFSETAGILALHTMFLILRTYISVFVARLDGRIVKDMVRGEWKSFFRSITIFMLISIPATYTNSMVS